MAVQAILNLLTLITRLILYIASFNAAISSPEIKKRLTSLLRQPLLFYERHSPVRGAALSKI
jgi:hypothetical protein